MKTFEYILAVIRYGSIFHNPSICSFGTLLMIITCESRLSRYIMKTLLGNYGLNVDYNFVSNQK